MWPFTTVGSIGDGAQSTWLVLYVLTLALHAVFVSYVLAGAGYALVAAVRKPDDALAASVRDWLPFMLGAGITAGVAPLLFVQLLYQRRFYTANLLMGPRWGAVVPALIIGFYCLYLGKAVHARRWRIAALAGGVVAFLFVAWSWTELHLLMNADAHWRDMYAAGARVFASVDVVPRLALWLGAMLTLFATVAVWSAEVGARRRVAVLALIGRAVSTAAGIAMLVGGFTVEGAARGWAIVMIAALAIEAGGWAWTVIAPASGRGRGMTIATAGGTAALIAGVVVREAPRLALLEPVRADAADAGGGWVFAITLVIGIAALVWIVRTARTASE